MRLQSFPDTKTIFVQIEKFVTDADTNMPPSIGIIRHLSTIFGLYNTDCKEI